MNDPLAGIDAKLQRGQHHLEKLEIARAAFLYNKPWEIAFERDRKAGSQWFLATFVIKREPPAEWSIRLGEAVHQYRASLDHLMTELVLLRHPGRRPDRTGNFPTCPEPGQFWAKPETGRPTADSIRPDVRPEHFAELERLQPKELKDVRGGDGKMSVAYALAVLRWVDDTDKHATVRPSFIGPKTVTFHAWWTGGDIEDESKRFQPIYDPFVTPLQHGTQLYRAQFPHNPGVSVPMSILPDITFGSPPFEWITLDTIRRGFEWVDWIIARFRETTPEFRVGSSASTDSDRVDR